MHVYVSNGYHYYLIHKGERYWKSCIILNNHVSDIVKEIDGVLLEIRETIISSLIIILIITYIVEGKIVLINLNCL